MKKIILLVVIIISLVVIGNFYVDYKQSSMNTYGDLGGDFTLQGVDGPISLSKLKGQTVVIYMGFTHCPDICPTSLSTMSNAMDLLPTDVAALVLPVFISVDYKRDTPDVADAYMKYYVAGGIGLTGSKEEIDKFTKQYGAYYKFIESPDSAFAFTVDHTSRFYIIDANGVLKDTVMDAEGAEALAKAITEVTR